MSALSRLLLVWFITLALPLQGLAAATRLVCGPATPPGHAQRAALPGQPAPQAPAHAQAGDGHGAPHAHAAQHIGPAQDMADGHHGSPAAQHKCSACAACSVAAALVAPAPPAVAAAPLVNATVFGALATPALGFVTGGPDRPPRSTRG